MMSDLRSIQSIESIQVEDLDPDESSIVTVQLTNSIIQKLRDYTITKERNKEHIHSVIDTCIEELLQKNDEKHHATTLDFDGRVPRKDVLEKFQRISEAYKNHLGYPDLHVLTIKSVIRDILGSVDPRTFKKYYHCIRNYVKSATGEDPGFYKMWNVKDLNYSVLHHLKEL